MVTVGLIVYMLHLDKSHVLSSQTTLFYLKLLVFVDSYVK